MMTDPLYLLHRLRALHDALIAGGFDHALGGGLALAMHVSQPRFTDDIDLNIAADPEHPELLLACLPPQIALHAEAADQIRERGQVRLLWPAPETPVDLFLPQHESYHRLVNDRAVVVSFGDFEMKVLSATDLTVFKVLFNRSKDWVDIETLLAEGQGDPAESARWIEEFLGTESAEYRRFQALVQTCWNTPPTEVATSFGRGDTRRRRPT